jgi:hypothetical protein
MSKSLLYKHILSCSRRKRIKGLTFFRQADDPIVVKCENFKVPQVSNVSWDVFKKIASQDLKTERNDIFHSLTILVQCQKQKKHHKGEPLLSKEDF